MKAVRAVRDLAVGGMGRVEIVVRREGAFARAYARKRLLARLADDGDVRAMFLEEGRIAGLVRHANVVSVLDVGEDEEGPFLLMDLVDGVPLSELVRRSEVGLPVQITVEIARQIAEGLHAAHELIAPGGVPMELVHRDLSPSNVLVGFDGVVRVTDFGVARAADRASTSSPRLVGKRSYMAPEQRHGDVIDRRADLFSLGIVIAEMLRGAPVPRDPMESPPDPGDERDDLPPELVALCFELTALDPALRPVSARLVATRLAAIHHDLRSEEDAIDLGELVRTMFAVEKTAREREMAEILRDADPTHLEITLPPEPERDPAPLPIGGAPKPLHRRITLGAAACACLLLIGLAARTWLAPPSERAEPEPAQAPQPAEPVAVRETTPSASAPIAAEPIEPDALEVAAPSVDEPVEARPRTPRRRRPRPRPPEPEPRRAEVRTWTWE